MSNVTAEGHSWTPQNGIKQGGFASEAVVTPAQYIHNTTDFVYDVVVVGSGYAGLCAARDLTNAGRSVLLLEGRDRIGGRSYTVEDDGFKFEMGGTWVHHTQAYTFQELQRYNLDRDLKTTREKGHADDYHSSNILGAQKRHLSHEQAAKVSAKGWDLFINVDGCGGKTICPLPNAQLGNVRVSRDVVKKWDSYSCWDRFEEIKNELDEEERGFLLSLLLIISGGEHDLKNSSLWDMIRSHALNGHLFENMDEIWFTYKLRAGQSRLARSMFDDAVEMGLQYSFKTVLTRIRQHNGIVHLHTGDGRQFQARKVICTVPLNVLHSLEFEPPLTRLRQEAIHTGHINFMTKIHAIVKESGMASWNGTCYPNSLLCAYGDGTLPTGEAHLIGFGTDERRDFVPERDPEKAVAAFQNMHPMNVSKLVFHNWNTDPFSQGGPCYWPPGYMSKYQDELQKRHSNVFFASADWAHGWRAFIDGALEQGFLNAVAALRELRKEDKAARL